MRYTTNTPLPAANSEEDAALEDDDNVSGRGSGVHVAAGWDTSDKEAFEEIPLSTTLTQDYLDAVQQEWDEAVDELQAPHSKVSMWYGARCCRERTVL